MEIGTDNPDGSKCNPLPNRKSTRLTGHDYSLGGAYFITICSHEQKCIFGGIADGEMRLSKLGGIVQEEWIRSDELRDEVRIDAFVVMPNHFHAIVFIDAPIDNRGRRTKAINKSREERDGMPEAPVSASLGALMSGFKSKVTLQVRRETGFSGKAVWQRNYYEHIIRNEDDYNAIRYYIETNPANWANDKENVKA